MKTTHLIAVLLATASSTAFAAEPTSAMTQDFVTKASTAGLFEIESSKLALEKSENADVKSFAKEMVADHTVADKKMKSTIADNHIDAKPAAALDSKHKDLLSSLKNAKGANFDAKYVDIQEDAHEEAVTLFTDYSTRGDNASLKKFAADTLPTLEKHKQHIESLDEKM
jgi:putative membrane protein